MLVALMHWNRDKINKKKINIINKKEIEWKLRIENLCGLHG